MARWTQKHKRGFQVIVIAIKKARSNYKTIKMRHSIILAFKSIAHLTHQIRNNPPKRFKSVSYFCILDISRIFNLQAMAHNRGADWSVSKINYFETSSYIFLSKKNHIISFVKKIMLKFNALMFKIRCSKSNPHCIPMYTYRITSVSPPEHVWQVQFKKK